MICIPKGTFKKYSHNPKHKGHPELFYGGGFISNPLCDFALEVLQICPSMRKALLAALGSTETCNMGTIMLDTTNLKPHLPYHVAFQKVVDYPMKTFTQKIFHTMVNEGASTCIMSLACWKAIGQPIFFPSPTLLTAFDGHLF